MVEIKGEPSPLHVDPLSPRVSQSECLQPDLAFGRAGHAPILEDGNAMRSAKVQRTGDLLVRCVVSGEARDAVVSDAFERAAHVDR